MAKTDTWIGTASADWGAAATNWSTGFPAANSNVRVNTAQLLTVSFSGSDGFIVNALAVGNDFFEISGGSLTVETTASFARGFTQTGGIFDAGGAVTITGSAFLTGGATGGKAVFAVSGTTLLANDVLGGSTVLNNTGTVEVTAGFTLGDNTGTNATINNKGGGIFAITGDYEISERAATARFFNLAGATLEKEGGFNTSFIDVATTDKGGIIVDTGDLEFEVASNSFAGSVSGPGQFTLGGGSQDLIVHGATITAAGFAVTDGGTVATLGENLGYAGAFGLLNRAAFDLDKFVLTLSGTADLEFASVEGTGALVTTRTSSSQADQLTLAGTVEWRNFGTVFQTGALFIGDTSASSAIFTNEKGGVYLLTDDSDILAGSATASAFHNLAGATLEKIGGAGFENAVTADIADIGAIIIDIGEIDFEGASNSFAGAISGAGVFALASGSQNLIAKGAAVTAGTFSITGNDTVVTLGENLSYRGLFELSATLDLGPHSLTLSGADTFQSALIDGGVLVTARGTTTTVTRASLAGSAEWKNSGTVYEFGTLTIGGSDTDTAAFLNEPGAIYRFGSDVGIALFSTSLSSGFYNLAGATLDKSGGFDESVISADLLDSGAIVVHTGEIECEGTNNVIAGAVNGAGQFALGNGSSSTIADGTAISAAIFGIYDSGTLVTLGENLGLAHAFNLEQQSALDLGAFTLTLSGADIFAGGPVIDGDGTLVTAKSSSTSLSQLTLGGSVVWQNSGAVNESGALTVGDIGPEAASFINASGGVYRFVNDSGIAAGAASGCVFVNQSGATLAKTGGNGDSSIATTFTNNGKVVVNSGTLEFSGAVGGTGSFSMTPGTVLQFDSNVASGPSVNFAGRAGGELVLLDSPAFRTGIHGFGGTDTDALDLRDISFATTGFKLSYSGNTTQGVLRVTDGTDTAKLTLFGSYTKASFHASSDGRGGTLIVDPPGHRALLAVAH